VVALVRGFEQALIALRAPAQCTGTPSFQLLVYHLANGLPQFVKPQAYCVGAPSAEPYLRTGYPLS